jgi:hypothetical protein
MAQENMMSVEFTPDEIMKIEHAIRTIEEIMYGKGRSLTPKERQSYGRVKYEKEVWVTKVKEKMDDNADTIPAYIDKAEFDRDYLAHTLINKWSAGLEKHFNLFEDTNRLLGFDLDESSLMYYRSIRSAAQNNAPGARTIYEELKQQFNSGGRPKGEPNPTK